MVVQTNSIKDYDIVYLVTVLCQDLKVCEQTNYLRSVHILINFRIYKCLYRELKVCMFYRWNYKLENIAVLINLTLLKYFKNKNTKFTNKWLQQKKYSQKRNMECICLNVNVIC